jgi:glycosyltransferase involved in cell wall biosynthesis
MRVVVVTVQVPFVQGGAEILAEELCLALEEQGHFAEIVKLPFKWLPPERILDQMLASRLFDVSESHGQPIDRVIGLKFPAYFVPHPSKFLWILHQHRQAYELWEHPLGDLAQFPNGTLVRDAVREADCRLIPEAEQIFTISRNVSSRLRKYCGIDSEPLYHPPRNANSFFCGDQGDYLLFPSRINQAKRQDLVVEAVAKTRQPVKVRFVGSADDSEYANSLRQTIRVLGVEDRILFDGQVNERKKVELYAHSSGVIFTPVDEDYGYITLEAMLSSKPVICCSDSGGPLEFVIPSQTGYVVPPSPECLADAMDTIWADRSNAKRLGRAGRDRFEELEISWTNVVERLVS